MRKYKLLNTIPFASFTELPMENKNLHDIKTGDVPFLAFSKKHTTTQKRYMAKALIHRLNIRLASSIRGCSYEKNDGENQK